jgi:transcriptional regulator with XRE-family HTH domain
VSRQPFAEAFDATPRTRLYPLPPRGLGTGTVEALSGYVGRLARAHSVSVGILLGEVFEPLLRSAGAFTSPVSLRRRLMEEMLQMIDSGSSWVPLVQQLTGQPRLDEMTVASWCAVVAERKLLRTEAAYCPRCFAEDLESGGPYERLSWRMSAVMACSIHHVPLRTTCLRCGLRRPSIRTWSVPGYCPRCWAWLGRPETDDRTPAPAIPAWSLLRATLIEEALARRAERQPPSGGFRRSILAALTLTGVSRNELSKVLGLRARANVSTWLSESRLPTIDSALRLAAATGSDLDAILEGNPVFDVRPRIRPPASSAYRKIDWPDVGRILAQELRRSKPRSLSVFSRSLGLTAHELKLHYPRRTQRLVERQAAMLHERAALRRTRLVAAVEKTVLDLQEAGIYPSAREVELALPAGVNLRHPPLGEAWRRATAGN